MVELVAHNLVETQVEPLEPARAMGTLASFAVPALAMGTTASFAARHTYMDGASLVAPSDGLVEKLVEA